MKKLKMLLLILFSFCSISNQALAAKPMIACSKFDTFGLNEDGTVTSARNNSASAWSGIVQISAYERDIVGLKSDGTLVSTYNGSSSWLMYQHDFIQVAAGAWHVVVLKSDGTVDTAGEISGGLTDVRSWSDIIQIAAGEERSLGLKQNGTVVAAGANIEGESNVGSWYDIKYISAGWHFSLGVKQNGTVLATGYNNNGQCNVSSWKDIVQTACGDFHSVGLKSNGTVVAVGNNDYGQCDVNSWNNVIQVSAGAGFTVALKNDGSVVAAGRNDNGEINVTGWDLKDQEDNNNESPIANAGQDQSVIEGDRVTLDGSGSSDPDDGIDSYQWEQVSGPDVTLSNATSVNLTFVAPDVNNNVKITFELTVKDAGGLTNVDSVVITVAPDGVDNDGDGFTGNEGDCNDNNKSIYPGATEICGDGIDQDCNGKDLACDSDSTDTGNDSGRLELIPEPPSVKTNGWLLTKIQSDAGVNSSTTYYTYDSNGDLIKEEFRLSGGAASSVVNYSHDSNGNFRKAEHDFDNNGTVDAITTYEYNSKGKLAKLTRDKLVITYFYDSNGNWVTTRTDGNGDGNPEVIETLSYNSEGKLVKITVDADPYPTPTSTVYEYDSEGKLIRMYSSSWSSIYTYNSDGILARIAYSGSSPSSSANYTWIKNNSANDNDGNNDNDSNDDSSGGGGGGGGCFISSLYN